MNFVDCIYETFGRFLVAVDCGPFQEELLNFDIIHTGAVMNNSLKRKNIIPLSCDWGTFKEKCYSFD